MTINIILADDHALVRQGVRMMLETAGKEFKVIGEVSNGEELLKIAQKTPADIYIVSVSMQVLNGIEAVHKLVKKDPKANVLVLSMYDDRVSVEKALKAGAKGFVVKVSRAEELVKAVREVAAGRFYFGGKISKFLVQGFLGKQDPK